MNEINYKQISEILFQNDPIGISTEGNRDEYDPEAKSILESINDKQNIDEIQKAVYQEFIKWFGEDTAGEFDKYKSIAEEISEIIKGK